MYNNPTTLIGRGDYQSLLMHLCKQLILKWAIELLLSLAHVSGTFFVQLFKKSKAFMCKNQFKM